MEKTAPNKKTKDRIIRIKLIDGSKVSGQININRDPGYDRASDLVTSYREPFLVLFNVMVNQPDVKDPIKYKTLFINKSHIIWASPEETKE